MANQKLNAVITIGGSIASSFRSAITGTKAGIGDLGRTIKDAESRQRMLGRAIKEFGAQGKDITGMRDRYRQVGVEIDKLNSKLERQKRIERDRERMSSARAGMGSAAKGIGIVAGAASTALFPIKKAIDYEQSMLGVAKQVNGAKDAQGNLTSTYYEFSRQIQLLGRELPMATSDIADMVAAGARMGIDNKDLIGFTKTAAKMSTAFDLPAGELADDFGKVANVFKINIGQIEGFADAINYLDDNTVAQGGEIVEVLKRVGGQAQQVGMNMKDTAAIGATFLSLGSRPEVAATATSALIREISIADVGPKKSQKVWRQLGFDPKQLKVMMAKDATGTILKVLDTMKKVPKKNQMTVATMLFGKEYGDDIAKLMGNMEELRREIDLANSAKAKGSMDREFQSRMKTTGAMLNTMNNGLTEVSVNIGSVFLPKINEGIKSVSGLTGSLADWAKQNPKTVDSIGKYGGQLAIAAGGVMGLKFAFNAVKWAIIGVSTAMRTNPVGAAITLIAGGAILIMENWGHLGEFFKDMWDGIVATFRAAIDAIELIIPKWTPDDVKANLSAETEGAMAPILPSGYKGPLRTLPSPAPASSYGVGTIQDSSQTTIHITQQPGESQADLAKRITAEQERARQARMKSSLADIGVD